MTAVHKPWNPAFDMPFTRDQALAVIEAWGKPSCMTFSAARAARVHECLTADEPRRMAVQTACGFDLGGWAYLDADGWHGGFKTRQEAEAAGTGTDLLSVLQEIAEYTGEGSAGTPWQSIVRNLGAKARAAVAQATRSAS